MVSRGPEKHVSLLQGPFNSVSVLNFIVILGWCTKECRDGGANFQLGGGQFVGGSRAILPQKTLKSKCCLCKKRGVGWGNTQPPWLRHS